MARRALHPGVDPDDDLSPFRDVNVWVFDLDDTLYAPTPELAAIYDERMRSFIRRELNLSAAEADRVRQDLYGRYGATVRGLMTEHGVSPDAYLAYVHDIDHSAIAPNPELAEAIAALPGPRYVLTNSPLHHAGKVLARLGMSDLFAGIFDFARSGQYAKPHPNVYARLIAETGADPRRTAIFEDLARNLIEPRRLGMATTLVLPPGTRDVFRASWDLEKGPEPAAHFLTENLAGFLRAVGEETSTHDRPA
ncbi:MAG: pyrimidine 5'-nucleotidase [Bauldia sp.]|nr:pyrimidine 5'-nucleotidase [Bauldia sp.]